MIIMKEGQLHCYFQGLAVISPTLQGDLDGGKHWIWPRGRVELWHRLQWRSWLELWCRSRRKSMGARRGSVGRTEKKVKVYLELWETRKSETVSVYAAG